jgi:DNA adenine methylase
MLRAMTYPGGKGGLFRQLINLIPAHGTYIETHLGHGAVLRNKAPSSRSIGIDLDGEVLLHWRGTDIPALELVQGDATEFLRRFRFAGDEFVYADPPYLRAIRRGAKVYRHELDDAAHLELLDVLDAIPAKVMLSGYASELYDQRLSAWRRLEFTVGSHGLQHREVVWLNYEPPAVPFDMRYAGSTFRERQRIKRKQHRIRQRIAELPPVERALFLQWVSNTYGDCVEVPA